MVAGDDSLDPGDGQLVLPADGFERPVAAPERARRGRGGRTLLVLAAALAAVASIGAGVAVGLSAGDGQAPASAGPGAPGAGVSPGATAHVHDPAAGAGAAADGAEGAPHVHGAETDVSEDNLRKALAFVDTLRQDTAKYRDVGAALADGYVQATQDLEGIAAHFVRPDYLDDGDQLDPEKPEVLLYTKRLDGGWHLVGVMFQTVSDGTTEGDPPSYFGGLDVWHYHEDLCFTNGGVSIAADAASCSGTFTKRTGWELHVWLEPGAAGIFSHDYAPIQPGAYPPASRPAWEELGLPPPSTSRR